jgi:hypothetical protein
MTDIPDRSDVTGAAPNRVTDESPPPPADAEAFRQRFRYYRHLIKVPEAVVRGGRVACPFCRGRVEICLSGYSGLGPSLLKCHRCGEVMISHRREWAELGWRVRLNYVGISLVYAMVSLMTGLMIGGASWPNSSPSTHIAFRWLLVGSPIAVIAIQTVRVFQSLSRTRWGPGVPRSTGFWTLDLGMQWKFLLLQILASIVLPPICHVIYR